MSKKPDGEKEETPYERFDRAMGVILTQAKPRAKASPKPAAKPRKPPSRRRA